MRIVGSIALVSICMLIWVSPASATQASKTDSAPSPSTAQTVTYRLRSAVRHLAVHPETHTSSYDRDAEFGEWIGQGNGCDTRAVVLEDESLAPVTKNVACTVLTGRWRSYYNATTYTRASLLQVDH